jgi:hypothetical protein
MNMQMALRRSAHPHTWVRRSWRLVQWLALAVLAAWMLHLYWPSTATGDEATTASAASLVHWKDADHDWLLVVDQATHELVVYDANDGRPLHRVGTASGAGPIDSIIGEGNWLIATSQQHPLVQVLSLPGLQPATLAAR